MRAYPDTQSPHCKRLVSYADWFVRSAGWALKPDGSRGAKSPALVYTLPLAPLKRARNDASKAARRGYRVELIERVGQLSTALRNVWLSRPERQNREINLHMNRSDGSLWDFEQLPWPIYDYREFDCPLHNQRLWGLWRGEWLAGFAETCRAGDFTVITQFMTHAAAQRDGASNALMLQVAADSAAAGCTHFSYGCADHRTKPMWTFLSGLGTPVDGGVFEDLSNGSASGTTAASTASVHTEQDHAGTPAASMAAARPVGLASRSIR